MVERVSEEARRTDLANNLSLIHPMLHGDATICDILS